MQLIMCPLGRELKFLKQGLESLGFSFEPADVGPLKCWRADGVFLAPGGHGKTQFGIQATFLINQLEASHLYSVGAAGGLSLDIKPGHIVAGTIIVEHDYIERFSEQAQLPEFICDEANLLKLQAYDGDTEIHFGPIASGDEDIVDRERAMEVVDETSALAVAWEGAGGARSARFHKIPYTELRGITDMASADASEDFAKYLKQAMESAASVLDYLVKDQAK